MPEISIIVPNYNTEKYLPRCLDSLKHQTFKDIEIILIDDGSRDKSVDIMRSYATKDPRIKVIKQENSGPAQARNQGLEHATGTYLMFCDSDDWYEPNMCEIMYNTIKKEKTDVVCCHNFFDWEDDLNFREKKSRLNEKYYNSKKSGKYRLSDRNILSTNVLLWNKIWRRDLINRYQIRFPQGHEHDDDAFWYMYAFIAKNIFYLKQQLYHYFLRSGSVMSTQIHRIPKNRMDRIAISNYILAFLKQHRLQSQKAYLMAQIFAAQLECACVFFSADEIQELCQNINTIIKEKLNLTSRIVYSKKNLLFVDKNILKLIYKLVRCRLALFFVGLLKNRNYAKHRRKYIHRIYRNKICWKYLLEGKNNN